MKFFILIVVLLKSIGTLSNSHEYFNISRRPYKQASSDLFQLPPSLCGESKGTKECLRMGGRKIGDCQCACDMKNDKGVTYKSTFGFYGREWKCVNNSALRRDTECLLVENGDSFINKPIPTTDKSYASFEIELRYNGNRCLGIISWRPQYNSSYQNCNGTWEFFNKTVLEDSFQIFWLYADTVLFYPSQSYPLPIGRLIRLIFECQYPKSVWMTVCILFKVEGKLKCPLPSATSTSRTTVSTSSPRPVNASSLATSSERISTIRVIANPRKSTIHDSNYSNSSTKATGWVITGSASGVVVFIIAITIIVVIVMRKRKRKREARKSERNPQTAEDPISNAIYVNMKNSDSNVPQLEYEIMPNTETDESGIKQEETSETLDSAMYSSLVGNEPHVYGSLKGPHKRHENKEDRQVACTSQNKKDDTYQQLDTFGQQNHGEYQALKYKKGKPVHSIYENMTM